MGGMLPHEEKHAAHDGRKEDHPPEEKRVFADPWTQEIAPLSIEAFSAHDSPSLSAIMPRNASIRSLMLDASGFLSVSACLCQRKTCFLK
ncbi:hypothetical protein [Reticulibacter mediterranei]|uniref:hypothetical protein n=1 Tax=Reticulibacter mediterranei TaxID=2778369 RepID=UPI001C6896E9|nr:hypothetical protein [Reticulibacter mediterranei]